MPGRGRPRSTKVAVAATPAASAISSFARVSKHTSLGKELLRKTAAVRATSASIEAPAAPRKRKATEAPEQDEDASPTPKPKTDRAIKRLRRSKGDNGLKSAPLIADRKAHRAVEPSSSDLEPSETQQAGALLERLNLHSSPSTRAASPLTASTPATSIPDSEDDELPDAASLPRELLDLINLHASFLKTLTLHFAHNGTNSPIDLRAISPSIAQAWGKRKVTAEDVRRCIGVAEASSPFFLADYGRGKICIELRQQHAGAPLNEKRLGAVFEERLQALWATRRAAQFGVEGFVRSLPQASIKKCEPANKVSPMLAKGQRTLQDLKNGITLRKVERETKTAQASSSFAVMTNPDGSKMSLLDRIRYKELLQSQQVQEGATPEDLARRAALQRAEDVAAVIGMLTIATAAGQRRIPFAMPVLLQKLRDSLRLPISREEGAACIRLLASEVAPQWLTMVKIGARENIVVQPDFQPTKDALRERVTALSA